MRENAKNPDRVFDKARECRFFLVKMADYEEASDIEKFLYCLSAFLSAFRTIAYRLYGVTESRKGKLASRALQNELHSHAEIGFLLQRSNVEVHSDGVVVHQKFIVHVSASIPDRWKSNWAPDTDRWPDRFTPSNDAVGIRRAIGWQFAGNPKNLIELCFDALNAMEEYARKAIVSDPSKT